MERSLHCVSTNFISLCGFLLLMLIKQENIAGLYAGIILATIGTYSNVAVKIAWFNNNL